MNKAAIAVTLMVAASPISAQVTGGSIGVEYSTPTDGTDLGGTTYSGAIEYTIGRNFAVSADLSGYRLDNISTDASSATLHGIYHLSETASVGAFYGRDQLDGGDARDLYGIEGGTEFAGGVVEGYIGQLDGAANDVTLLGVDGQYGISNGFSVIGNAGFAFSDAGDISRFSLGAEYELSGGPQFYAELGSVSVESGGVSADQTFIGVGARVAFGAQRGTTFGSRSLFEITPGF